MKFDYEMIGTGDKVIVIETGIGNAFYDWYPVVEELKEDYRILLYHRLGYGKSDRPNTERTTHHIASELYHLTEELNIPKCLLIGHSFGGLCVQHFAALYPEKVEAVLLVDSASYNLAQLEQLDTPFMNAHISIEKLVEMSLTASKKSQETLLENNKESIASHQLFLDDTALKAYTEFVSSPVLNQTVAEEFSCWILDGETIKALNSFPNVPLKVICRDLQVSIENWCKGGVPEEEAVCHDNHWRKLQVELSELTEDGELLVAKDCDHMIHIENPQLIIKTIKSF